MKRLLGCAALMMACLGLTSTGWSAYTITVTPAFGPSVTSPNWTSYVTNAMSQLQAGTPGGPRVTPATYEVVPNSPIAASELLITPFNSWRGVAGPAAPFNGEFGNAIYFGLHVVAGSPAEAFNLNELYFQMDSNDPQDTFDGPISVVGGNYRSTLIGINYGGNGMLGGGDDTIYNGANPAPGSTNVHEIYYLGVAGAYDLSGQPGATNQDKINSFLADSCLCETTLSVAYAIQKNGQPVGQGDGSVVILPEPSSLALALLPMLGLVGASRRRK